MHIRAILLGIAVFAFTRPAAATDFYANEIPTTALKALEKFQKDGATFKCLAFRPEGGWIFFGEKNSYFMKNVPEEHALVNEVRKLRKAGSTLKSIAFTKGDGCVIIYDENGFWFD